MLTGILIAGIRGVVVKATPALEITLQGVAPFVIDGPTRTQAVILTVVAAVFRTQLIARLISRSRRAHLKNATGSIAAKTAPLRTTVKRHLLQIKKLGGISVNIAKWNIIHNHRQARRTEEGRVARPANRQDVTIAGRVRTNRTKPRQGTLKLTHLLRLGNLHQLRRFPLGLTLARHHQRL